MATVRNIQTRIRRIEGFDTRYQHYNGRDVMDNKQNLPRYPFSKAARGAITVAQWKEQRIYKAYPGFKVAVFNSRGRKVNGRTLLETVRRTYGI